MQSQHIKIKPKKKGLAFIILAPSPTLFTTDHTKRTRNNIQSITNTKSPPTFF